MKRYLEYTIRMKFTGTSTILKRYQLSQVGDGKLDKHAALVSKVYSDVYNTDSTQLVSITCTEITEEQYNERKSKLEEEE
ncbi:hypothetical protein COJ48_19535 [Bacillus cereus]|nr:hypothetical protein COJ48_19535 [Bacillus cereus]PGP88960.1 hypothetical protein CN997_01460 [Bacillus cereus]